jgi:predicted phosphodiesterase
MGNAERKPEEEVTTQDQAVEEGSVVGDLPELSEYEVELEEGLIRVEDENRKLRSALKEAKRESTLFRSLASVIRDQPPFSSFSPYKPQKAVGSEKIKESALLVLSDMHGDQEILPRRVQGLENYNFEVACLRAENIVDTTISHLKDNMTNYSFDTLYIAGLGDYVNGDIHNAQEHSKWKNAIKNSMGVGEMIAMMVTDFSKYFKKIVFCSVAGNHGRRQPKKDYRGANNNWDYLVAVHAATRLQGLIDEGRLEVKIPDAWSMGIDIEGWNFVLNHGDDVKGWNGIPFYGIERKTRRLTALGAVQGRIPNYYLYGHFHTLSTSQHTTGEVVMNGSWMSTDEYALESLGAYSEPFQWLMGVHEDYGLTWRLPIKLRSHNWKEDEKRRSRYSITMFGDEMLEEY